MHCPDSYRDQTPVGNRAGSPDSYRDRRWVLKKGSIASLFFILKNYIIEGGVGLYIYYIPKN